MKSCVAASAILLASLCLAGAAQADERVRCESTGNSYQFCPTGDHGYVRLDRQLSNSPCRQGRTWDYDRRGIWVDDGCRADFVVEGRAHSGRDSGGSDAAKIAAAIAAIAIVAAASKDSHDRHQDDGYSHGGHSSHIPGWMTGSFYGRNDKLGGGPIELKIVEDGRAAANVAGHSLKGYVNDDRLYIGDNEFLISRTGDGIRTQQVGHGSNVVYYQRR